MTTSFKKRTLLCMIVVVATCVLLLTNGVQAQNLCPGSEPPPSCAGPINCFRPDPVCGANGVTYWCGCPDAACAGVPVVKLEAC
ncbi:hypothetical protein RCOM_1341480 [Ricinus communis]|uniref:Kazal-like domain-containing protein n=1 Tax=Ricinus communis TaxID=3988 RepID=B9RMY7_RICCO|nr:hypothetical protein RCOM_1341480 [Ricinus communis]